MADTTEARMLFIAEDQVTSVAKAIAQELGNLNKSAGAVGQTATGSTGGLSKFGNALGDIAKQAVGMAAGMAGLQSIQAVVSNMTAFVSQSVQMASAGQALGSAFAGITGNAEAMLVVMRQATGGMVNDVELMRNYNMAAQLVSKTFADQLPEAMGALQKVSLATGQSMDYMMTSLIRGVGRMSPMILDNLAIQVSLEEATARAAQMYGVETDALTKAQQQAGMMSVVLEKLKANTADMGSTAGTAATAQATLTTATANLKTEVGTALLPVTQALNSTLADLVTRLIGAVQEGEPLRIVLDTIAECLIGLVGVIPAVVDGVDKLITKFREFNDSLAAAGTASSDFTGKLGDIEVLKSSYDMPDFSLLAQGFDVATEAAQNFQDTASDVGVGASKVASDLARTESIASSGDVGAGASARASAAARALAVGAKEPMAEIKAVTQETIAAMQTTWDTGLQQIGNTISSHYQQMAQITNTFQMDNIRAEAEYSSKRAAMVAAGMVKEVAELDRGFAQAKILRDLDHQISVAQAKAKYEAELNEQMKAFGQKMALWVQEATAKGDIELGTANAILMGLQQSLGAEVAAEAGAAMKIIEIAQRRAAGEGGSRDEIINAIGETIRAYKAEAEAAAAAGAATGQAPASDFAADIQKAYDDIGKLGAYTAGAGVSGGATKAIEKRAEEVTADIAKTIESLTKSIAETMRTLSEKLPEIPADVVGQWLDKLSQLTHQVAGWMGQQGTQFRDSVAAFKKDLLPSLEDWAEQASTINDVLSALAGIYEAGSSKLSPMRTSVGEFFSALQQIFWDVRDYVDSMTWVGKGAGSTSLIVLSEGIIDWLNGLKASAEPLQGALEGARGIIDALVDKIPDDMGTSIAVLFECLQQFFVDVESYVGSMTWAGGGGTTLAFTSLIVLSEDLIEFLNQLTASSEPLRAVLESTRSIIDALVPPLKDMGTSINDLFIALQGILLQVAVFFKSGDPDLMLSQIINAWSAKGGLNETFAAWATALAPLKNLLDMVIGIIELVTPKLDEVQMSIDLLFTNLKDLLKAIQYVTTGALGDQIQAMIDAWGPVNARLSQWVEVLRPVSEILSTIKGIMDVAGQKTGAVKMSVLLLFDNLQTVLEQVKTQVEERSRDPAFQAAIDAFKEGGTLISKLKELGEAMKNIKTFIDPLLQISDEMGKRLPIFRLSLAGFFDLLKQAFKQINDFFHNKENQKWIDDSITAFEEIDEEWLGKLEKAMETLADKITSLVNSGQALGPDLPDMQNYIDTFLTSLTSMGTTLLGWLDANEMDFGDITTRFENVVASVLQILATGVTPVDAEGKPIDNKGMESGLLMELLTTMTGLVQLILDQFKILFAGIMGYVGAFGSISLRPAAERVIGSFIEGIKGKYKELYQSGWNAANQWMLGWNARLQAGSPSQVMIAAGKSLADSVIMGSNSQIDKLYDAGWQVGTAMQNGIKDALDMHSPSGIGVQIGTNLAKSIKRGAGGGKIAIEMEPMYAMGKTMGAQIEEGFRDRLGMHSPSTVIQGLAGEAMSSGDGSQYELSNAPAVEDAVRYWHEAGRRLTARDYWLIEQELARKAGTLDQGGRPTTIQNTIAPQITFAGDVSVRSDQDIERLADEVSRRLAQRFSDKDRWGAKVT